MSGLQKPPKTFNDFVTQFPQLGEAWELMAEAGREGPLDARTARLIKLGIAAGAMREGAVHAGVRKAIAMGLTPDEIHQVVALCAGTLGLPATVAVYSWCKDELHKQKQ